LVLVPGLDHGVDVEHPVQVTLVLLSSELLHEEKSMAMKNGMARRPIITIVL
jgi:hypothetical protein